ncbi:GNAT family N-acetyltransferase [Paracoccus aestuariivivens]|uniref:GNAT family N-acetyltransferase n=1 Tax=Paracoccus aestuariivivens TaxID=1820333 RepID=A0A6L6J3Z1_9RHOB|nr:GNAT family N-acetyltransferase [Paracoccus aestuariivivens]MTH76833.1 GNAT family N-acetyltransferase [Paracoccus aestuariivivens]
MTVRYRNMTANELPLVLDWAAAEGWNPGLDDATPFYRADPQGFFVAKSDGKIVAAISVVNHNPDLAFLGLYLCRSEFRGRGIGFGLWQHALSHAGTRTVGLDGVAAQQANYARSGFVLVGSTSRYSGRLAGRPDRIIRCADTNDHAAILQLDANANGYARPEFLGAWLLPSTTRTTLIDTEMQGFVTIRKCREGAKIGPLVAPDADRALVLAQAALSVCPADSVAIDLPDSAVGFRARLIAHGFSPGFSTARMFRGPAPVAGPNLQAIATMEVG